MIRIRNIYYMLAYAFQVLDKQGYRDVALESEFENTAELLSAILCKGVSIQIKRGLVREYIMTEEALSSPKGKIKVSDSVKILSLQDKKLVCAYDEFSTNAYYNRILKTTFLILLKTEISKERKREIRKLLIYFNGIEILDIHSINWNQQYNRNNQTYQMLISVCYMILKGLLQTTKNGDTKLMDFLDEQRMCRLYEKFILKYYRKHFPKIKAEAAQIPWILDDGCSSELLPTMQSDITLSMDNKVLIIDAKYYAHNTQVQYNKHTLHSNNLYQIFTYVKNKEAELRNKSHEVSGMLLYAQTDDDVQPDNEYMMSGNKISVTTLNLDCDFIDIQKKLNQIVEKHFG